MTFKRLFTLETYDTEDYPASVARVMRYEKALKCYFDCGGTLDDNIKCYVRWLRYQRDFMYPNNPYKKGRKFVQVHGLSRKMTVADMLKLIIRSVKMTCPQCGSKNVKSSSEIFPDQRVYQCQECGYMWSTKEHK